jgi:predicted MPP superfamily phosphohydrolase
VVVSGLNAHRKRFSSRGLFWLFVLCVLVMAHAVIYLSIGRVAPRLFNLAWFAAAAASLSASAAAPRLSPPRNGTGRISLCSVLQRCGAFWNIFVLLTAVFTLITRGAANIIPHSPHASFAVSSSAALAVCLYGLLEARRVRAVSFRLCTGKLPKGRRLRIAQISDLHIGPFMNIGHISRIVNMTLETRADLVAVTGDTVDGAVGGRSGPLPFYAPFSKKLKELADNAPPLGVWAVPGNHEHYEDFEGSGRFIEDSGMKLLRGEKADLGPIVIVGADDLDHIEKDHGDQSRTLSQALVESLSSEERKKFVLFLRHRPVVEQATVGIFDLQLSGHTHGGQLFPLPSSRHKIPGRPRGLRRLGGGSSLYVSNGSGFVGPPMRFFAPPEIVVIDLIGE